MKIYSHRVNTKIALQGTDLSLGVEIDLRSRLGSLILSHDPFVNGELFSDWLTCWRGQPLILNVKEDALEEAIIGALSEYDISDYFFLDQSFPSIRRVIGMGITKVATRVSDFEDLSTALKSGSDWVWLDSFSGNWDYLPEAARMIVENGQRTCLVSPELQRVDSGSELTQLKELIFNHELQLTAVCTKKPESWNQ